MEGNTNVSYINTPRHPGRRRYASRTFCSRNSGGRRRSNICGDRAPSPSRGCIHRGLSRDGYAPSLEGAEALVAARLDRAVQEYTVLTGMTPTTVAGCAALLRYIEAHEAKYRHEGVVLFSDSGSDEIRTAGKSLLSRIASALDAS
jgi:hypothetical protein